MAAATSGPATRVTGMPPVAKYPKCQETRGKVAAVAAIPEARPVRSAAGRRTSQPFRRARLTGGASRTRPAAPAKESWNATETIASGRAASRAMKAVARAPSDETRRPSRRPAASAARMKAARVAATGEPIAST